MITKAQLQQKLRDIHTPLTNALAFDAFEELSAGNPRTEKLVDFIVLAEELINELENQIAQTDRFVAL